jgi:hypothetical protein
MPNAAFSSTLVVAASTCLTISTLRDFNIIALLI